MTFFLLAAVISYSFFASCAGQLSNGQRVKWVCWDWQLGSQRERQASLNSGKSINTPTRLGWLRMHKSQILRQTANKACIFLLGWFRSFESWNSHSQPFHSSISLLDRNRITLFKKHDKIKDLWSLISRDKKFLEFRQG